MSDITPAPEVLPEAPKTDENGEPIITEEMVEYGSFIDEGPQTPAYEVGGIPPQGAEK